LFVFDGAFDGACAMTCVFCALTCNCGFVVIEDATFFLLACTTACAACTAACAATTLAACSAFAFPNAFCLNLAPITLAVFPFSASNVF